MPAWPSRTDLTDVIGSCCAAASRGDVEALMRLYTPEIVWDLSRRGLGTFEGRAQCRAFMRGYLDPFEGHTFNVETVLVLDNGVVFAVIRQEARPAGIASPVTQTEGWVHSFSTDGLISRVATYADMSEARAAAERLAESRG